MTGIKSSLLHVCVCVCDSWVQSVRFCYSWRVFKLYLHNYKTMASRSLLKLGALEAPKTAFLLCDLQETFRAHVKHFGEVVKVANKMLEAAKHFQIPVYISEQYPKGLGHTTKDIKVEDAAMVYEKTKFSMYTPELKERLKKDVPGLASVVLFGIEAHVCIEQTVIDLLNQDIAVHVLADGVSSRSLLDRGLALQVCISTLIENTQITKKTCCYTSSYLAGIYSTKLRWPGGMAPGFVHRFPSLVPKLSSLTFERIEWVGVPDNEV